jgi:hypothetical protein
MYNSSIYLGHKLMMINDNTKKIVKSSPDYAFSSHDILAESHLGRKLCIHHIAWVYYSLTIRVHI